jgi:two-component system phosphate regulon sensor histidine kinase PhoR
VISKYRLFLLVFLPAALILGLGVIVFQEENRALSAGQFEALLKNQWLLVSMVDEGGLRESVYGRIASRTGLRISLVSRSGEVVYDTSSEGRLEESHSDRPEIKGAFAGTPTMAVRRSGTTGVPTIYYADVLGPGTALRVAYPAEYYERQERALLGQAFGGLCVLAAAAAAFALLASRRAGRAMRELGRAVDAARDGREAEASFGNDCLDGALHSLSVTTRRLRELDEERAALNRRLEYVLENISDGVILFRGEDILYSNAASSAILGASVPGSVSGANDPALIALLKSLAEGDAAGEIRLGGRVIAVAVAGDEGPDDEGEGGRVVILHDMTDREKYGLYKADLVSNISHELKTPLAVILTASEVTLKEPGMPEPVRTGFLETIRRNVLRLTAILDDLDYLHRLESVDEAVGEEADLAAAVDEARETAGAEGKTVEVDCDPARVAVYGPHLVSVVANLVSNAVRYSSDDLVRVTARASDGAVTVEVEDGGPPVPPSERQRIFERFYSLSRSRNRDRSGSGLGLSIVKHIAMIYDGSAEVGGNRRGGNTFRVRLKERRPPGCGSGGLPEGEGSAGGLRGRGPDFSGKP